MDRNAKAMRRVSIIFGQGCFRVVPKEPPAACLFRWPCHCSELRRSWQTAFRGTGVGLGGWSVGWFGWFEIVFDDVFGFRDVSGDDFWI